MRRVANCSPPHGMGDFFFHLHYTPYAPDINRPPEVSAGTGGEARPERRRSSSMSHSKPVSLEWDGGRRSQGSAGWRQRHRDGAIRRLGLGGEVPVKRRGPLSPLGPEVLDERGVIAQPLMLVLSQETQSGGNGSEKEGLHPPTSVVVMKVVRPSLFDSFGSSRCRDRIPCTPSHHRGRIRCA